MCLLFLFSDIVSNVVKKSRTLLSPIIIYKSNQASKTITLKTMLYLKNKSKMFFYRMVHFSDIHCSFKSIEDNKGYSKNLKRIA